MLYRRVLTVTGVGFLSNLCTQDLKEIKNYFATDLFCDSFGNLILLKFDIIYLFHKTDLSFKVKVIIPKFGERTNRITF